MTDLEHSMRMAVAEIESLRRRNEVLQAKIDTVDSLLLLFHTKPAYPSGGMGTDPVWLLREELKKFDELEISKETLKPHTPN